MNDSVVEKQDAPSTSGSAARAGTLVFVAAYSFLLLACTLAIAAKRSLWWDEILTYFVATLPDFSSILAGLRAAVDGQPPPFYAILHTLVTLGGSSPLVLRLPSVFAYWLATLLVFSIARKRTNLLCACAAAILPALTGAFAYATEARPYALVLFFAMAGFWCWQRVREERFRRICLVGLTLSLAAAVSVQYYGFLTALPLVVGEVTLFLERRRFDYAVASCIVLAAVPVLFMTPYIAAVRLYATDFPTPINLNTLFDTYWSLFGRLIVLTIIALAAFLLFRIQSFASKLDDRVNSNGIPASEWAAAISYLLLPLVGWCLALITKAFYPRYVLSACLGAGILLGYLLFLFSPMLKKQISWVVVALALFASLGAVQRWRAGDHSEVWGFVGAYTELLHASDLPPSVRDQPLILGAGPYLIAFRYADEDARRNYFYLVTPSREKGHVAVILRALHHLYPDRGHLTTLAAFRNTHSSFNVYEPDGWFLDDARRAGAHLSLGASLPHGMVYRVDFP